MQMNQSIQQLVIVMELIMNLIVYLWHRVSLPYYRTPDSNDSVNPSRSGSPIVISWQKPIQHFMSGTGLI